MQGLTCTRNIDDLCCRYVQHIGNLDGATRDALVQTIKQGKQGQQNYKLSNAPDAKVVRDRS